MLQARDLKTEHGSRNERKHDTEQTHWGHLDTQKEGGVSSTPRPDGPTPHTDVAPDKGEDLRTVRQQKV